MRIEREKLLATLSVASVGLSTRENIEQSNCFVFTEDELLTFNGEILTRCPNPLEGIQGAVPSADLLKLLGKLPDETIEVKTKGDELRVKGKRRDFGLALMAEIHLPYDDIPKAKKWRKVPPALLGTMLQAARVCGKDEAHPRTTEVHVCPDRVEACDNFRLFRSELRTGIKEPILVPAMSVEAIGGLVVDKFSPRGSGGWLHLRTKGRHSISVRCSQAEYPDVSKLLTLENPKRVILPGNLQDVLSRAEVMHEGADALVSVEIDKGKLTLRARKETGWYREVKRVKYKGDPLRFHVNPAFLEDVLNKTRRVLMNSSRMRIEAGDAVFVVSLEVKD